MLFKNILKGKIASFNIPFAAYDSGEGGDGGAVPQLTARGRATLEHLENIFDAGGVPAEPGVGNRAALNGQGG